MYNGRLLGNKQERMGTLICCHGNQRWASYWYLQRWASSTAPACLSVWYPNQETNESFHSLLWPLKVSVPEGLEILFSPYWLSDHLPWPPHTQYPTHQTPLPWRPPPGPLESLPGSGLSFPTKELELGVILEASSGVRGMPPPRSMVLAPGLAGEVRVGLAWEMAPLGRKPEMGLAILLMVQGESAQGYPFL